MNKVDIENYDQLDWTVQGGEAELHVKLDNHYLITVSQVFVLTLKVLLQTFSAQFLKVTLVGALKKPEKLRFI